MDLLDRQIVLALLDREQSIHQLSKTLYKTTDQWALRRYNSTLRYRLEALSEEGVVRKRDGWHGPYYVPLGDLGVGEGTLRIVDRGGTETVAPMGRVLVSYKETGERVLTFLDIPDPLPRDDTGWVYFLFWSHPAGQRVKIGFSKRLHNRMGQLKPADRTPVVVLGAIRGTMLRERELHRRFASLRIAGEWFRADPALLSFIETENQLPETVPRIYARGSPRPNIKETVSDPVYSPPSPSPHRKP